MRRLLSGTIWILTFGMLTLGAGPVSAVPLSFDSDITVPNTALAPYTAPYAHVNITWDSASTSAHVVVTASNSLYLIGNGNSIALNTTQAATLSGIPTFTGGCTGGGCPAGGTGFTQDAGNVSDFGVFNFILNNNDGLKDAVSSLTFNMTGSTAWGSSVLAFNAAGFDAAAHIFVCETSACESAIATGFAGEGGTPVPEPATLLLLGSGLAGLGFVGRKRLTKRDQDSA